MQIPFLTRSVAIAMLLLAVSNSLWADELADLIVKRDRLREELEKVETRIAELDGSQFKKLPAPLNFIAFDAKKYFERDRWFTISEVAYGKYGSLRSDGIQWKLKATKDIPANDVKYLFDGKWRFLTTDNEEVSWTFLIMPSSVESNDVVSPRTIKSGDTISIILYVETRHQKRYASEKVVKLVRE